MNFLYNEDIGRLSCGLIYFMVVILIGWYLWFRDEGKDEIQDVYKDMFGARLKLQSGEEQQEFKDWWDSLSDEERDEVINTIHSPGGNQEELK